VQFRFRHRAFRNHDILPSNNRLKSSSSIRTSSACRRAPHGRPASPLCR
jgi:hypothetical protein